MVCPVIFAITGMVVRCTKDDSYRPRAVLMLDGPDPEMHVRIKGGCPDFSDDETELFVTMGSYWSSGKAYT